MLRGVYIKSESTRAIQGLSQENGGSGDVCEGKFKIKFSWSEPNMVTLMEYFTQGLVHTQTHTTHSTQRTRHTHAHRLHTRTHHTRTCQRSHTRTPHTHHVTTYMNIKDSLYTRAQELSCILFTGELQWSPIDTSSLLTDLNPNPNDKGRTSFTEVPPPLIPPPHHSRFPHQN